MLTGQTMNQDGDFKEMLNAAEVLPMNQKAELMKKLLNSPGLSLVFVDSPSVSLVGQINAASWETLAEATEAIAARLAGGEQ